MRALLVGASPAPGGAELLSVLAPDFDLVVAVDGGADVCQAAGVRPDLAIGDFDSIRPETLRAMQLAETGIVSFPVVKDETDLELAFRQARQLGADQVTVTSATAGRLDHLLGVIASLRANADLAPELVEPQSRSWVLAERGRSSVSVTGPGTTLSLIPLSGTAIVSVSGVRWPLDRVQLTDRQSRGISNVVSDESAMILLHEGVMLVNVPHGV